MSLRSFVVDWYGKEIAQPIESKLSFDRRSIELGFRRHAPAVLHPKAQPGNFVEGLWEYDVIELFLATSANSYLEINLAPNGSWWAMQFVGHRRPAIRQPKVELLAHSHSLQCGRFECLARFCIPELEVVPRVGNLCGIVTNEIATKNQTRATGPSATGPSTKRPSATRCYFSLHQPPEGSKLDFHNPELFRPLE